MQNNLINATSGYLTTLCQQLYPLKKLPAIPVFTKMFFGIFTGTSEKRQQRTAITLASALEI